MATKTVSHDSAAYLETPEDEAIYLSEFLADGDLSGISHALGVIARARGMTAIAREAGVTRESLYRALSENGNPELGTVLRVLRALGIRLSATPAEA